MTLNSAVCKTQEREFTFDEMSRIESAVSWSVFMSSSMRLMELSTVEWFLPSYMLPMSTSERFVRLRMRYMETCRALATFFERLCPVMSACVTEKYLAVSSIMMSGVGM